MSRIGKQPIPVPEKVNVTLAERSVEVKGPKGTLAESLPEGVTIRQDGAELVVERVDESRIARSAHGLARTLVQNMVTGVVEGFTKTLLINGVGYRAEDKGNNFILFTLGYSHPILYELPEGITAEIDAKAKEPTVKLSGCDRQVVGQTAAEIRGLRPPEPYKGKGIRYADERIRRKEGKAGGK